MENFSQVSLNRAKPWQIALFPFNNAATNVYFAFYTYFTYYALMYLTGSASTATLENPVLVAGNSSVVTGTAVSAILVGTIVAFTSIFVPCMRIFDGITDPVLGGIMDKTKTRFGKFRPFMVIGNFMLALSVVLMMAVFRGIPDSLSALRWVVFIVSYIIYVLGYTCQCAVTKAGQTCLTNDPRQRSLFVVWNMIGMVGSIVLVNVMTGGVLTVEAICPKGAIFNLDEAGNLIHALDANGEWLVDSAGRYVYEGVRGAAYGPDFYNIMVPFVVIISAIYTVMAVAAISGKDRPEFWGVSGEPAKLKDYAGILKENKEIRWLVLSAGLNKLASTVATSGTVAFLVYGCLMGDYNGLFIPFYALCFVFMGLFFIWGSKTAGAKGQKRGVAQFTVLAFIFYIGVLILLIIYDHNNPATHLSIFNVDGEGNFHLTVNLYTVLFIIFYGCGYGAFNCCDNLTIPMVADCTDYETYRSGKYVPGIMGTVFSLVDKVISSLQTPLLTLFIVVIVPGLPALPAEDTTYLPGMELSAIICFCILPMTAWLITIFCMTRYGLSGKKLVEIQAVNAVRKAAISGGMSPDLAMQTWKTIDQVPAVFVAAPKAVRGKRNVLDRIYDKFFTKRESVTSAEPSSNPIDIPEEYLTDEVKESIRQYNLKQGENL